MKLFFSALIIAPAKGQRLAKLRAIRPVQMPIWPRQNNSTQKKAPIVKLSLHARSFLALPMLRQLLAIGLLFVSSGVCRAWRNGELLIWMDANRARGLQPITRQ